jgi:hypothetical protein
LSDDLAKFKLAITQANTECRELLLEESRAINKIIQEMQAEKALVDGEISKHWTHIKKLEEH